MHTLTSALLLTLSATSPRMAAATPLAACIQDGRELPAGAGPGEKKALSLLKAREESGKVVIHYRHSKWMSHLALKYGRDLARTIQKLEKALDMSFESKVHILLYKDEKELAYLAGVHHAPKVYIRGHFLHAAFDQELEPHLAQILIRDWIPAWRKASLVEERDRPAHDYSFIIAGLALALTREKIHEITLRDWIAFHDQIDPLPRLELLERSYPRIRSQAPSTWIAASWARFLLDTYGVKKVKRYCGTLDCKRVFDHNKATMDTRWKTWLEKAKVDLMATALYGFEDAVVFEKKLTGIRGKVVLKIAGDDRFLLFHNGKYKAEGHIWFKPTKIILDLEGKDLLEIVVMNEGPTGGLLMELVDKKGKVRIRSDRSWTARRADADARPALVMGPPLSGPWVEFLSDRRKPPIIAMRGSWIWHP